MGASSTEEILYLHHISWDGKPFGTFPLLGQEDIVQTCGDVSVEFQASDQFNELCLRRWQNTQIQCSTAWLRQVHDSCFLNPALQTDRGEGSILKGMQCLKFLLHSVPCCKSLAAMEIPLTLPLVIIYQERQLSIDNWSIASNPSQSNYEQSFSSAALNVSRGLCLWTSA